MGETRAGKYGRQLAIWINYTINRIPKAKRASYRTRFLRELKNYSFVRRAQGQPRNSGCVNELENIVECEITNPKEFAKIVKEGIHLMYQKQTAGRVMESLLDYL